MALLSPLIFFACPGGSGLCLTDALFDLILKAQLDNETVNRAIKIIVNNLEFLNFFIEIMGFCLLRKIN